MKENELRDLAECCCCNRKIGELPTPIFNKVTVERHILDISAATRQDGLTTMMGGNAMLAHHMGPDEDMTAVLGGPFTVMLCDQCLLEKVPGMFAEGKEGSKE